MAVRIRMKKMGRKHRPFFRICADGHRAARATAACWKNWAPTTRWCPTPTPGRCSTRERIDYWLSVGAQPSDKVQVLIKKYGAERHAPGGAASGPASGWRQAAAARAAASRCPARRSRRSSRRPKQPAEAGRRASRRPQRSQRRRRSRGRREVDAGKRPIDAAMRFDVLTLFPGIFQGYLGQSLLKRAIERGLGRRAAAQHPRLGARTSTTRSTTGPSAAGPAWC